jgi:hypothetical protein
LAGIGAGEVTEIDNLDSGQENKSLMAKKIE